MNWLFAVVLSGSGADGSVGLRKIKEKGGLVIVQDPEEAEFDGMPRSAIATGAVDFVASVADIPDLIFRELRPGRVRRRRRDEIR